MSYNQEGVEKKDNNNNDKGTMPVLPKDPPSYEETMRQDTASNNEQHSDDDANFQNYNEAVNFVTERLQSQTRRQYIHQPHSNGMKGFPGSQRITYNYNNNSH